MEQKMQVLESQIQQIKNRNQRVESDKAWEGSWVRKGSIIVITYIIAAVVMHLIGVDDVLLNALIPTLGYLLSTLSLRIIKKWWVRKYYTL